MNDPGLVIMRMGTDKVGRDIANLIYMLKFPRVFGLGITNMYQDCPFCIVVSKWPQERVILTLVENRIEESLDYCPLCSHQYPRDKPFVKLDHKMTEAERCGRLNGCIKPVEIKMVIRDCI
jgi:hypothetical protein